MILRDPVHGLVAFEGEDERVVMALLASKEVQRLRRVRQLGLTSLVFPGADHTRFAHALGAAHVMVRLLDQLVSRQAALPAEHRADPEARRDAIAAALLHDLGHGPFSHMFEEVLSEAPSHEKWTLDVLAEPDTEVHRALEGLSAGMSARVAALLTGSHPLGWLSRTLSGTLDVDRCDYLLRDSHMTGVRYGLYDLDWLLTALTFAQLDDGRWVLAIEGRKGLPPIEAFFLGRHFMFQQVYHHKATRAAECLIRGIFKRVSERVLDGAPPANLPPALRDAVLGAPLSVSTYLALDDPRLITCFADWEHDADEILADFARRLMNRRLPKTLPLPEEPADRSRWTEAHRRASEVAEARGLRADLTVFLDEPDDVPYFEPNEASPEGLWVSIRRRPLTRLGSISFLLRQLRNQTIVRPRLVFPGEIREDVEKAVTALWS